MSLLANENRRPWEYLFFILLYPLGLLPVIPQTVLLIVLALILLVSSKPRLDRFFLLMFGWCGIYLITITRNLLGGGHVRDNVITAFFTLGLNVAALLFYIHFRNININLTRVGKYAFRNLIILSILALVFLLIPASREWTLLGRSMAEIDIVRGDYYDYRFCGFLGSTYAVIFFVFFNFPLSIYYVERRLRKRWQILYALLILVPVRAAGSRIGLVLYGLLFVMFLFIELHETMAALYRKYRGKAAACLMLCAVILFVCGAFYVRDLFLSRPSSNLGRLTHYVASYQAVMERAPFLGLGINERQEPDAVLLLGSHSTYLNVIYRTGIIGAAIYAAALLLRLYDLFKDKVINKQRVVYIIAILETFLLMVLEDVDVNPWTICFLYIMIAIFDRISQPVETLAIKPSLNIAMLGQKHIRYREGGIEVVVAELSTRMVQLGHHVICYDRGGHHVSGKGFDSARKSDYHGVVVKEVLTIDKKGLAAFSSAFFAAIQASFSDADVIHFHAEGPCIMMWLPRLFGKCCVCTIHGIDWQRAKWHGIGREVIHCGERVAAREADEIIVLSRSAQDYFWNTYRRKTVLIPNGIDNPEYMPVHEIERLYGLHKDEYLLFLGRIVPEKGIHYLIHAFRGLDTRMKLVIAGGASDTDSYYQSVQEMAAGDDRIIFTGFIQGRPMQELYSNAYLYVLPSDLEGMPLTILEAMSYGNCCVVSDIPECADVIGDAGITFQHGNEVDLEHTLQQILKEPETVARYRAMARERVRSKYSWDDVVERTIRLYRGTLDQVSERDAVAAE